MRKSLNLDTAKLAALVGVAFLAALGVALLTAPAQGAPLALVTRAAELLSASVVRMTVGGSNLCSASKIGPATFLTAAHCARGLRDNYRIERSGSRWGYQFIKSITITVSEKKNGRRSEDWAVLHASTEDEEITALELACSEEIYLGMPVAYAGFPAEVDFAFGIGYVASVNRVDNSGRNDADFVVDLQAAPGASGSPVISLVSGKIIGILTEGVFSGRVPFLVGIESIKGLDLCDGKTDPETTDAAANPF